MSRLHADPWRAVCPNGHSSWRSLTGGAYVCEVCGPFDELHDAAVVGRDQNPARR